MLGFMINKVREDKNMSKVELAQKTGINIGHLTHIEKEERVPSHKALRKICEALKIPYQSMLHMYDRNVTEEGFRYKLFDHISYNKVPAFDSPKEFIECPYTIPNASLAFKIQDASMEPKLKNNSYVFLELNAPLENKDYGLFIYNGKYLVRKFIIRQDKLVLRPENKAYDEISLSEDDEFTIVGKIIA